MGLVSAFTDLVCVLRRECSMSDEVREALAIALDFLVEHDYLMKPLESYLSAAKQCGVRANLTPVDRWSSSEDAPWAEVISAPRTMSSGQCASHASSAKAPAEAGARASEQQSAPCPNAGKGPQTMAQRPALDAARNGQAEAGPSHGRFRPVGRKSRSLTGSLWQSEGNDTCKACAGVRV